MIIDGLITNRNILNIGVQYIHYRGDFLLPFPLNLFCFGHWWSISVTFPYEFISFRSLSGLLCYLSLWIYFGSVTERPSLLPFPLNLFRFGHWEGFSVTFPSEFISFRSLRAPLLLYSLILSAYNKEKNTPSKRKACHFRSSIFAGISLHKLLNQRVELCFF